MKIFYSAATNSFYSTELNGDAIPTDAVEVSAQTHTDIMAAVATGQTYGPDKDGFPVIMSRPAPSVEVLKSACKEKAKQRLANTDFSQVADVRLMLTNVAEFDSYRSVVRGMFLNPVPSPAFPDEPVAVWKE